MSGHAIPFPMSKRVGRIREVAAKLLSKPTERAAAHYRALVTNAALLHLDRAGISNGEQEREIAEFWRAVEIETLRVEDAEEHWNREKFP